MQWKIMSHTGIKQENTIHNENNKQSVWTYPKLTQVLEFVDKNIKRVITVLCLKSKDLEDMKHTNLTPRDENYSIFHGKYTEWHKK